jgi:6-phosphogluconolactonase
MDGPGAIERFPDAAGVARRAAQVFERAAVEAAAVRGRFSVALAGGRTPRAAYEILAGARVPWERAHVFWGDERNVPPEHPESNYRMAWESLLSKVPVPAAQVHPVRTRPGPPETAAADYERGLKAFFGPLPKEPLFDLALLGVGADGHTASLFPGDTFGNEPGRWFVSGRVRSLDAVRFTLTYAALNRSRIVAFLAAGREKAEALGKIWAPVPGAGELPAGRIRPESGRLLWIVDEAAASKRRGPIVP